MKNCAVQITMRSDRGISSHRIRQDARIPHSSSHPITQLHRPSPDFHLSLLSLIFLIMPKDTSKSSGKKAAAASSSPTPYAKTKSDKRSGGPKAIILNEKGEFSHIDKYDRMYFIITEDQFDRLHAQAKAMNPKVESLPILQDSNTDHFMLRAKFHKFGNKASKNIPEPVEGHEYRIDALMYSRYMTPMDEEGDRDANGRIAVTYIKMKSMTDLSPPDLETVQENEDEEEED